MHFIIQMFDVRLLGNMDNEKCILYIKYINTVPIIIITLLQ